jgi:hypothetical protein
MIMSATWSVVVVLHANVAVAEQPDAWEGDESHVAASSVETRELHIHLVDGHVAKQELAITDQLPTASVAELPAARRRRKLPWAHCEVVGRPPTQEGGTGDGQKGPHDTPEP